MDEIELMLREMDAKLDQFQKEELVDKVTPMAARHQLFLMREVGGWEPGSFSTALIELLPKADPQNLALLARSFPAEVAAYQLGALYSDGVEVLRNIAEKA